MALWNETRQRHECECGCGEEINPWARWKCGHWFKTPAGSACVSKAQTGKVHTPEHCKKASEGINLAYKLFPEYRESVREGQLGRHPSPEAQKAQEKGCAEFWSSPKGKRQKELAVERNSGERNPNWKGGLRQSLDYGYGWSAEREFIIMRDNYTCQGCGKVGWLDTLFVHHIDSDISNWDRHNEITVCPGCNSRAASVYERDYWLDFYTKKIHSIYSTSSSILSPVEGGAHAS